jgi:hypothetical protein
MNETMRFFKDMKENGELAAKLEAKIEEIKAANKLTDSDEIKIKAANALGYAITREQLDKLKAEAQELSDDDLEKVGGGLGRRPQRKLRYTAEEIAEQNRQVMADPDCYYYYGCDWLWRTGQ